MPRRGITSNLRSNLRKLEKKCSSFLKFSSSRLPVALLRRHRHVVLFSSFFVCLLVRPVCPAERQEGAWVMLRVFAINLSFQSLFHRILEHSLLSFTKQRFERKRSEPSFLLQPCDCDTIVEWTTILPVVGS
jgi:hypothetical protein